jgi:hypothetical protein
MLPGVVLPLKTLQIYFLFGGASIWHWLQQPPLLAQLLLPCISTQNTPSDKISGK